jgi:hypothetical protein
MTTINRKFIVYLMACYLYYVEDLSVLPDTQFDELCKDLLEHWDEITHFHKHLTTKEDLEAGTGFSIKYPTIVVCAARKWYLEGGPLGY